MALVTVGHPIPGLTAYERFDGFSLAFVGGISGRINLSTGQQTQLTGLGYVINPATPAYESPYVLDSELESQLPARLSEVELRAAFGSRPSALVYLDGALATRTTTPVRIAFAGSSTTAGSSSSGPSKRWVNLFTAALQAKYPSGLGSESTVIASIDALFGTLSTAVGIHGYNAGQSSTTSATYLTADEISRVANLNPRAVIHMVGSNDFATNIPPATYKANVQAVIAALKAQTVGPCVHILIQPYERWDGVRTYPWAAYGQALSEIAAADPASVAFIDISATYYGLGIPDTDPLGLMNADHVHQNDLGHALMADLVFRALFDGVTRQAVIAPFVPGTPLPDNTAPAAPTGLVGIPGLNRVQLAWDAATDNLAVTGYKVRRDGTIVATALTTSYSDTGLTAGTAYTHTVSAIDAAGNESPVSASVTTTPAAAQTVYVTDDFNRADAASLGTATTGQVWESGTFGITSNAAKATSNATALIETGHSDFEVSAAITITAATTSTLGISFNAVDANNRLSFYRGGNGAPTLAKVDGGTLTVLLSSAPAMTDATHTLTAVSSGATVLCYLDGTLVYTYTLTSAEQTKYKVLTKVGLRQSTSGAGSIDNFSAKSPA